MLEVNHAAARFFRRELFRTKDSWARGYLERGEAFEVLEPSSSWIVGFAPDSPSRLVNHLRSQGFDMATVRNAGLGIDGPGGRLIDRFRDQLMLPARNHRLEIVGFIAVHEGSSGPYYRATPATQVHQRSTSLVGLAEQSDLLSLEATPVLVNDPMDAFAIERVSRLAGGGWVGIPLCDGVLSAEQARMLGIETLTGTVIVATSRRRALRQMAAECLDDLSANFPRVQAVELPDSHTPASLWKSPDGHQRLHDALLLTRPLADYARPRRPRSRGSRSFGQPSPDVTGGPHLGL
ncbi:hypothetical protein OG474_29510 [Kribbella sp. NBC_01505]|uniref:hypothetical protein n=1 Tax=Kribbella sp. NBC_01505 TaxID=2903580 RepID=UPI00386777FB